MIGKVTGDQPPDEAGGAQDDHIQVAISTHAFTLATAFVATPLGMRPDTGSGGYRCRGRPVGSDLSVSKRNLDAEEPAMRKIIYWVHTSVDGFIDGPNGEFDWPVMGPELSAYSEGLDRRVDTLLFGRPVWQMMVGFWPAAESISDDPHVARFAPFWRETCKIVVSRTYPGDEWTSRVIGTDLAAEVTALKAQPGRGLLLTGGVELAASLTELGLIDEYHIAVHPVVLGGGRRLFAEPKQRINLRLVDARPVDGQVVVQQYQRYPYTSNS
jgi:dihydrofolate reductase